MHRLLKSVLLLGLILGLLGETFPVRQFEASHRSFSKRGDVLYREAQPFSGRLIERYDDGLPYRVSDYRNGLKQGLSLEFAINGRLVDESWFEAGLLEGLRRGWFFEGPPRYEFHYVHGLLQGTQSEWHVTGALFRQQNYQNGHETQKKIFYSGGEIFTNLVVKAGRSFGLNGGPLCMEPPKDGELLDAKNQ